MYTALHDKRKQNGKEGRRGREMKTKTIMRVTVMRNGAGELIEVQYRGEGPSFGQQQ